MGRWDLDPDPGEHQNSWEMDAHSPKYGINGNFRNREELEVPTIFVRPMLQAYVREYPHTITIDGIVCFIHNQFFAQAGRIELVIGFYKATNMRRMRRGAPLF